MSGTDEKDRYEPHGKGCYLSTVDLYRLDLAVTPLHKVISTGNGGIYLVGSVNERPDFRDVDVRMILPDDEFEERFGHDPALWETFCYAVSRWLSADTGLPIDFQVQQQTKANDAHEGSRNPLSGGHRRFAGLGDATWFEDES